MYGHKRKRLSFRLNLTPSKQNFIPQQSSQHFRPPLNRSPPGHLATPKLSTRYHNNKEPPRSAPLLAEFDLPQNYKYFLGTKTVEEKLLGIANWRVVAFSLFFSHRKNAVSFWHPSKGDGNARWDCSKNDSYRGGRHSKSQHVKTDSIGGHCEKTGSTNQRGRFFGVHPTGDKMKNSSNFCVCIHINFKRKNFFSPSSLCRPVSQLADGYTTCPFSHGKLRAVPTRGGCLVWNFPSCALSAQTHPSRSGAGTASCLTGEGGPRYRPRGAKLEKSFHPDGGKTSCTGSPTPGIVSLSRTVIDFLWFTLLFPVCECELVVGGGFSPGKPKDDRRSGSQQQLCAVEVEEGSRNVGWSRVVHCWGFH